MSGVEHHKAWTIWSSRPPGDDSIERERKRAEWEDACGCLPYVVGMPLAAVLWVLIFIIGGLLLK